MVRVMMGKGAGFKGDSERERELGFGRARKRGRWGRWGGRAREVGRGG